MPMWIPLADQDHILDRVAGSDEQCVCSQQPTSYWNACRGILWTATTSYVLGDVIYPPTPNGYVYECVIAGDSGGLEPAWATVQDDTFNDGTVTWKAHENYALANTAREPADFVKDDATLVGDGVDGRKLTIAQKIGIVTHTSGTVTHTAWIASSDFTVRAVTTAETTLAGGNDVESGRTTLFFETKIIVADPSVI